MMAEDNIIIEKIQKASFLYLFNNNIVFRHHLSISNEDSLELFAKSGKTLLYMHNAMLVADLFYFVQKIT